SLRTKISSFSSNIISMPAQMKTEKNPTTLLSRCQKTSKGLFISFKTTANRKKYNSQFIPMEDMALCTGLKHSRTFTTGLFKTVNNHNLIFYSIPKSFYYEFT